MIFMSLLFVCRDLPDCLRDERQHREVTRALDRLHQLALVSRAGAGDSLGNNLSLLRNEPYQPLLVLVIDIDLVVFTKPADAVFSNLLILFGHGLSSL